MKIQTFNILKPLEITEKRSPWKGVHESGLISFPAGEFTDEEMKAWIDGGVLELHSEKEVEDEKAPGTGEQHIMTAETGSIGAEGNEVGATTVPAA